MADDNFDGFMKLTGIGQAESSDADFPGSKGYMELDSLTFSGAPFAGAPEADPTNFDDSEPEQAFTFTITKTIDKASPYLFTAYCKRQGLGKKPENGFTAGELVIRKSVGAEASLVFVKMEFKVVYVNSLSWNSGDSDNVPTETVSFGFDTAQITYQPQNKDGTLAAATVAGWNFKDNLEGTWTPPK